MNTFPFMLVLTVVFAFMALPALSDLNDRDIDRALQFFQDPVTVIDRMIRMP